MEPQFIAGMAMTAFGFCLIMLGVLIPDFMFLFLPLALVFIFSGIALKVISVKHLG